METVLEISSYVGWVLLAIMILVFVHEMGHFLFAKLFKMRVDRFSVGFPPNIVKKKFGETEYAIGATPLGGYVKISGMVDESMDTDYATSEPQAWEFRAKPVWQRIVVITAGVVFNFLLAFVVFSVLQYQAGEAYIPAENIDAVYIADGSIMHEIGLRTGDRVLSVNGRPIERADDIGALDAIIADQLSITVERNGEELTFFGPEDLMTQLNRSRGSLGISFEPSLVGEVVENSPASEVGLQRGDMIVGIDSMKIGFWNQVLDVVGTSEGDIILLSWRRPDSLLSKDPLPHDTRFVKTAFGSHLYEAKLAARQIDYRGSSYFGIGIGEPDLRLKEAHLGIVRRDYDPAEAVVAGGRETWLNGRVIVTALSRVVTGREDFRETMGGPVAIARETKRAADGGYFWQIVALLSITLGIVNILPIPALDGGHLVFLVYEGVTRREPSLKLRMVMQQVGMIVLLVFMAFLIFNDILRL